MLRSLSIFSITIFIASCAAQQQVQPNTNSAALTQCSEQRPQVCTREYLPVCATRDTGIRCTTTLCPSSEQKTYSNGCEACADKKVLGYIAKACLQESSKK